MVYWILSYANQHRNALYQIEAFVNRRSLPHTALIEVKKKNKKFCSQEKEHNFRLIFREKLFKNETSGAKVGSTKVKHSTQT